MKKRRFKKGVDEYWFGLAIGLLGGALGNLWVAYWIKFGDTPTFLNGSTVFIATIVFFGLAWFMMKQATKNVKKG